MCVLVLVLVVGVSVFCVVGCISCFSGISVWLVLKLKFSFVGVVFLGNSMVCVC